MEFHLPTNFVEAEFACPCCGKQGLRSATIFAVQALRNYLGFPLTIGSGFRCVTHNAAEGGKPRSQHPLGTAIDIEYRNPFELYQIVAAAPRFGFNGIGFYKDLEIIHLDLRKSPCVWVS